MVTAKCCQMDTTYTRIHALRGRLTGTPEGQHEGSHPDSHHISRRDWRLDCKVETGHWKEKSLVQRLLLACSPCEAAFPFSFSHNA